MLIEHIITALVFLLSLALIAKPVSKWIHSIAFGVVIFSLFIQAPSMRLLVNGLEIRS